MPTDPTYMERLVVAFTDLLKREKRTSLTDGEMAARISLRAGRVISSQVVGRWVAGKVKPRNDSERKAFADVLGVPAGWLFWGETAQAGDEAVYLGPVPHEEAEAASGARAAKLAAQREAATQAAAPDPPAQKAAGGKRDRGNPRGDR